MNNFSIIESPHAVPIGKTFTKWAMSPSGSSQEAEALQATTLDQAVKLCTPAILPTHLANGGFAPFVILETDDRVRTGRARQMLHFYVVKAKREWRPIGPLGSTAKAAIPYAVHQGSLPMNAFEPRRPFKAAIDCPGTGRQPGEGQLIELNSITRDGAGDRSRPHSPAMGDGE